MFKCIKSSISFSFWGKFAQATNMGEDVFITDPSKFTNLIFDPTNKVSSVQIMNDKVLLVKYKKEEEFAPMLEHTNPVVAAFCTSIARLKLYEQLEKLGPAVLYFDTGMKHSLHLHTNTCTHLIINF